jgi:hypothetical protein
MANAEHDRSSSLRSSLVAALKPTSVLGLAMTAFVLLIFAIFIFGSRGRYSDPDVSDILRTASVGIISAGVATLIDRNISFSILRNDISDSLQEAHGISQAMRTAGVRNVIPEFDFGLPFREARKGETVSWLDTYCPRENEFMADLLAAVARGVRVRMLIIDPGAATADMRNGELVGTFDTGAGWTAGLQAFIAKMKAAAMQNPSHFEIRQYNDLPCVPMYMIAGSKVTRKAYFSIFLTRPTERCAHVELRAGSLLEDMSAYFDAKWARHAVKQTSTITI